MISFGFFNMNGVIISKGSSKSKLQISRINTMMEHKNISNIVISAFLNLLEAKNYSNQRSKKDIKANNDWKICI